MGWVHRFRICAVPVAAAFVPLIVAGWPHPALAHATERGFVLLLPTGYYLVGGALTVAASFLLLFLVPATSFRRLFDWRRPLGRIPAALAMVASAVSFVLMVVLIVAGYVGTGDPLENPLPLTIWTWWWVVLAIAHAIAGNIWAAINPWTAPCRLVRRLLRGSRAQDRPPLRYPSWLGYWPAVAGLFAFGWFELVALAPDNPPRLATAVMLYWSVSFLLMLLFGEREWRTHGECFSVIFGLIARLAPLQIERQNDDNCRAVLVTPGAAVIDDPLPASGVAFVLLMLATVSFDGLSKTFFWLGAIGINPLEVPGRSAVVAENSAGLAAMWLTLGVAYAAAMLLGNRIAGRPLRDIEMLGAFVLSILPISVGYHFSHYLTGVMVNAQYSLVAFNDPFARGWALLGIGEYHVSTSFLTTYESVSVIWKLQVAGVVAGHILAVALSHAIAVRRVGKSRAMLACQLPLAILMVGYTVFGLWLLATPAAG